MDTSGGKKSSGNVGEHRYFWSESPGMPMLFDYFLYFSQDEQNLGKTNVDFYIDIELFLGVCVRNSRYIHAVKLNAGT